MNRVKFVLAVPRGTIQAALPVKVSSPGEVLGPRAAIWWSPATPIMKTSGQLVIGIAFASDGTPFRMHATEPVGAGGAGDFARDMLARCWGAYCAVVLDRQTGELFLLLDPSGLLPVYRLATESHLVLTTHPGLLKSELGLAMPVDYRALAEHLLQPELRQARTCLEGLDELEPGTLANLTRCGAPLLRLWSPVDHALARDSLSLTQWAAGLRDVGTRVMRSWANVLGEPAVAVSGGVDSSFICAALASSGSRFACTTLATAGASGDERCYARQIASAFDRPIIERTYDVGLLDPAATASAALPRPSRRLFQTVVDELLISSQRNHACAATFDGNGGDNLFCLLHSTAPVIDRMIVEGPGRGALETMIALCAITGCSLPTVTASVIRRSFRRSRASPWSADTRLLNPQVHILRGNALTPWTDLRGDILPGKREHIVLIMRAQNHINGLASPLTRFSPLVSQPLVEFCLRVPTWHWSHGGKNRAVARAAFADILPVELMCRTSKAGPDSFVRQAFAAHREQITERLMDGLLACSGLIDRVALGEALSASELSESEDCLRALDLLEAENWARSWS